MKGHFHLLKKKKNWGRVSFRNEGSLSFVKKEEELGP
jgi:hypothetical protein